MKADVIRVTNEYYSRMSKLRKEARTYADFLTKYRSNDDDRMKLQQEHSQIYTQLKALHEEYQQISKTSDQAKKVRLLDEMITLYNTILSRAQNCVNNLNDV